MYVICRTCAYAFNSPQVQRPQSLSPGHTVRTLPVGRARKQMYHTLANRSLMTCYNISPPSFGRSFGRVRYLSRDATNRCDAMAADFQVQHNSSEEQKQHHEGRLGMLHYSLHTIHADASSHPHTIPTDSFPPYNLLRSHRPTSFRTRSHSEGIQPTVLLLYLVF
jgi:hypothetical protein